MHFLDLYWGAPKHHKIDPNSSRFFWNVTRCVSMFYSKSVKNELQDSVKCAKNFEVPRKDIFSVRHEPNRKNILIEISQKSMGELKFTHSLARNCPPSQFSHISWGSSKRSLIILYVTVPDHFLERSGLEEKNNRTLVRMLPGSFLGNA